MRRVEVTVPEGKIQDVAQVVFACGIREFSVVDKTVHRPGAKAETKHVIDMNVATPEAKAFVGQLAQAPFFDRQEYHVSIRQPRANLTGASRREITRPVPAPILDIDQELWQFTHITASFVIRVFIASVLLAYGMIEEHWLLMAAGLIFLPFMPLILAMSYGALTSEMRLFGYGAAASFVAVVVIVAASALVAFFAEPPMQFDQFPPLIAGVIFSALTGVAAGLAMADDAGHRQLIGLAAASQLALLPAWFGISLVHGFTESIGEKLISFGANVVALTIGALAVYAVISARAESPPRIEPRPARAEKA